MLESKSQERDGERAAAVSEPPLADLFAEIVRLAHHSSSTSVFYRQGFRLIAEELQSPYASISLRRAGVLLDDYWHTGPADPGFWKPAVDDLLTTVLAAGRAQMRMFKSKHSALKVNLLSAPLVNESGLLIGAIALCVQSANEEAAQRQLSMLTSLSSLMSYLADGIVTARQERQGQSPLDDLFTWDQITGVSSASELAFRITNDLRTRLDCDLVALGVCRNKRVNVISISKYDSVSSRNPGVRLIGEAMEECFDFGGPIVRQDEPWGPEELLIEYRLHHRWAKSVDQAAVASVPVAMGDDRTAIISMCAKPGRSFSADVIEDVAASLAPAAGLLPLMRLAKRTVREHVVESARDGAVNFAGSRGWFRLAVVLAFLSFVGWFVFGSMPYRVAVPFEAVPTTVQHVVAPFDGGIKAAYVAAGDEVTGGQLLFELETNALELERKRLMAEIEVAGIEVDRALAADELGEAGLAAARKRVIEARLLILEEKLDRSVAHAAFDGIVLSGDLSQLTGQTVSQGDGLYVVAPRGDWKVELVIPQIAVDELRAGLGGYIACDARPEERQSCRIVRMLPSSQVRDGRSVFIAEAEVSDPAPWVRPGMQGVARVDAGRRPVWWVATHGIVEYVRRTFWL